MTLYRKYRPQKLSELDSSEVREKLTRILSSSYAPHAFIFSGPKGTGKTSAARIVAKIYNCEKKNDTSVDPCDNCSSCTSIISGRHLDVLEIDAASNRGIEEIRELREKIKLAPSGGKFKVYIIDEVHMLTNEAFNALLKTLEEPPAHAVFILATTEPDKLLPTITSRCVNVQFNKASLDELTGSLERVLLGEKLKVDKAVLKIISTASDGSFRDATKFLEQAISEDKLTAETILSVIGRSSLTPPEFLLILKEKKTTKALEMIEKLEMNGSDIKIFVSDILRTLHGLLLEHFGVNKGSIVGKEGFTVKELTVLIRLFSRVYTELRNSSSAVIPLEVAVVEWCEGE